MRRTVTALPSLLCAWSRSMKGGSAALALSVLALGFLASGCENQSIGRTCEVAGQVTGTSALANPTALECPSRVCLLPSNAGVATNDTKPFCTAECGDDSDCEDGEKRAKDDPNDKRCTQGYACMVPVETGSLVCKKLCVCKDFLPIGFKSTSQLPAACVKR